MQYSSECPSHLFTSPFSICLKAHGLRRHCFLFNSQFSFSKTMHLRWVLSMHLLFDSPLTCQEHGPSPNCSVLTHGFGKNASKMPETQAKQDAYSTTGTKQTGVGAKTKQCSKRYKIEDVTLETYANKWKYFINVDKSCDVNVESFELSVLYLLWVKCNWLHITFQNWCLQQPKEVFSPLFRD